MVSKLLPSRIGAQSHRSSDAVCTRTSDTQPLGRAQTGVRKGLSVPLMGFPSGHRLPGHSPFNRKSTVVNGLFGRTKGETDRKNPFANFSELLDTAKDVQARAAVEAEKAQQELASAEFEGYDIEESVKVVVSGNQEPRFVELTQDAIDMGAEGLSMRLVEAMQDAHLKSVFGMKNRMTRLYEDLGFPMPPQI